MARQQSFQHAAANGCEAFLARGTDCFGMRNSVAGAAVMVVTGRRKRQVQVTLFGFDLDVRLLGFIAFSLTRSALNRAIANIYIALQQK